jgi:hypothetical protein
MENPADDNSNIDKYTEERVESGIQELLEEKELKIKWRKELEQNEAVQNYFKNYSATSVKSFIDSYLNSKHNWVKYGDMYKEIADKRETQWIDAAHEHLGNILQKKLFDLQCLWRAEQIKLPGIEICFDFTFWERDIFNCPFLEPIKKSDVEMYEEFLLKGDFENATFKDDVEWQDYDELKEAYQFEDSNIEFPSWYDFHNTRTGNTKLLLLPDIRGEKEDFYNNLVYKDREEKALKEAAPAVNPDLDSRLNLPYHTDDMYSFFVTTFEDKEVQKKYKSFGNKTDYYVVEEYVEIVEELLNANEFVPIKAHYDFREALKLAHHEYRCKRIVEHLPTAYEQYLFNKKMGFSIGKKNNNYQEFRNNHIERLLNGRALNGEARNLDF